jgi:hypothetical protein
LKFGHINKNKLGNLQALAKGVGSFNEKDIVHYLHLALKENNIKSSFLKKDLQNPHKSLGLYTLTFVDLYKHIHMEVANIL